MITKIEICLKKKIFFNCFFQICLISSGPPLRTGVSGSRRGAGHPARGRRREAGVGVVDDARRRAALVQRHLAASMTDETSRGDGGDDEARDEDAADRDAQHDDEHDGPAAAVTPFVIPGGRLGGDGRRNAWATHTGARHSTPQSKLLQRHRPQNWRFILIKASTMHCSPG